MIVLEKQEIQPVVEGNTAFALDLYQQLRANEGNLFFSPYSISAALAMTYAGARGNTEAQMAQTLHFTVDQAQLHPAFGALEARLNSVQQQGHVKLGVANSLWPQKRYDFLPEFLALTKEYYGAEITSVDYANATEAARLMINEWVEARTEKKITDLLPPGILDTLTRLVLVNAIYFKGNWASQFDQQHTSGAAFWLASGKSVTVPMMNQMRRMRWRARQDGLQILELPYAGDDLSMVVLLPDEIDGLATLEKVLTARNLALWTVDLWETEVDVFLPRFKLTAAFRLDAELQALGMTDAFSAKADFSGMDGRPDWLYIASVLHKAFVDVNEEGTEAAAATAVVMGVKSLPFEFRADHPFIFLIHGNVTHSILFLGRVVNPVAE